MSELIGHTWTDRLPLLMLLACVQSEFIAEEHSMTYHDQPKCLRLPVIHVGYTV